MSSLNHRVWSITSIFLTYYNSKQNQIQSPPTLHTHLHNSNSLYTLSSTHIINTGDLTYAIVRNHGPSKILKEILTSHLGLFKADRIRESLELCIHRKQWGKADVIIDYLFMLSLESEHSQTHASQVFDESLSIETDTTDTNIVNANETPMSESEVIRSLNVIIEAQDLKDNLKAMFIWLLGNCERLNEDLVKRVFRYDGFSVDEVLGKMYASLKFKESEMWIQMDKYLRKRGVTFKNR